MLLECSFCTTESTETFEAAYKASFVVTGTHRVVEKQVLGYFRFHLSPPLVSLISTTRKRHEVVMQLA